MTKKQVRGHKRPSVEESAGPAAGSSDVAQATMAAPALRCCTDATQLAHGRTPVSSNHICREIPPQSTSEGMIGREWAKKKRIASATCPDVALANEEAGQ